MQTITAQKTIAPQRSLLRTALTLDAVVTAANGAAYLALAGPLDELLGLSQTVLRGGARSSSSSPRRLAAEPPRPARPRSLADRRERALGGRQRRGRPRGLGRPDDRRRRLDSCSRRSSWPGFAALQLAGPSARRGSVAVMTDVIERPRVGPLLREWRQRRRMSQLDLALEAGVSARHLSFVETGRSRPSAEMVLHLAEQLDVPLRERNQLLLAAGYAPAYGQRGLDDPEMEPVREALERVLAAHEPYPALVVDRHWGMVAANRALAAAHRAVVAGTCSSRRSTSCGSSLHPEGMAPRIANLGSGARTCSSGSAGRPSRAATRRSPRCTRSSPLPGGEARRRADRRGRGSRCRCACATRTASSRSSPRSRPSGRPSTSRVAELAIESFFPADERAARFLRERSPARRPSRRHRRARRRRPQTDLAGDPAAVDPLPRRPRRSSCRRAARRSRRSARSGCGR